jgi:hypothetical protein
MVTTNPFNRHPIDGTNIENPTQLCMAIKKRLTHTLFDDSFDHAFGTEHAGHVELDQISVEVLYPDCTEVIPVYYRDTYEGGGCSGEHQGKCKPKWCAEVSVEYEVMLDSIQRDSVSGRFLATYDIKQGDW